MSAVAVREISSSAPDAHTGRPDAGAPSTPFKYRAFISYSHRDSKWVRRFHRALENQRIDKDLAGRETAHGAVLKSLRPIFRDRDDFSAGHSLTEQSLAALQASHFLIVVCSPNAARSPYVDQEIRYFKSLGRGARVINVIIGGEPGDPEHECFPPAVRQQIGPDGRATGAREEPIAADARPQGDGPRIARLKIVAGLLGVGFDEIMRRAERARKRRNRVRAIAAVTTSLVVVVAVIGWRGVHLLHDELLNEQDINGLRDVAEICEGVDTMVVADASRLRLAHECVLTFNEVLADVPPNRRLPKRVMTMFEKSLVVLRRYADRRQLTTEQLAQLKLSEGCDPFSGTLEADHIFSAIRGRGDTFGATAFSTGRGANSVLTVSAWGTASDVRRSLELLKPRRRSRNASNSATRVFTSGDSLKISLLI